MLFNLSARPKKLFLNVELLIEMFFESTKFIVSFIFPKNEELSIAAFPLITLIAPPLILFFNVDSEIEI